MMKNLGSTWKVSSAAHGENKGGHESRIWFSGISKHPKAKKMPEGGMKNWAAFQTPGASTT